MAMWRIRLDMGHLPYAEFRWRRPRRGWAHYCTFV